jgi:hypothetical protein
MRAVLPPKPRVPDGNVAFLVGTRYDETWANRERLAHKEDKNA